jgi:hypothetical protein
VLDNGLLARPLRVQATNTGNSIWLADTHGEKGHVNLGGHLFAASGELVNLDYFRMPLAHDLGPGETTTFQVCRLPELAPGIYQLEIDLVDEGICWFKQWGTVAQRANLTVRAGMP